MVSTVSHLSNLQTGIRLTQHTPKYLRRPYLIAEKTGNFYFKKLFFYNSLIFFLRPKYFKRLFS